MSRFRPTQKGMFVYAARGSDSARTLSDQLDCRRWREGQHMPHVRRTKSVRPWVINWGSTVHPEWLTAQKWPWPNRMDFKILNKPEKVKVAVDKKAFFKALYNYNCGKDDKEKVPILQYHYRKEDAAAAMRGEGEIVKMYARYKVNGTNGDGITIYDTPEALLKAKPAPLYTAYFPKTHEFRVHVFRGKVIDFTQKRLREGAERNGAVRNLEGGWIHAHELDLVAEDKKTIGDVSCKAVEALGLDFGAVDVLALLGTKSPRKVRSFAICEINTGPGLGNTSTITAYKNAILSSKKSDTTRTTTLPSRNL